MSDQARIRVLHVVPRFKPGGVSRVIENLIGGDDDNFVSAVAFGSNEWPGPLEGLNVPSFIVPFFPSTPGTFAKAFWELRRVIRDNQIDVVHSHHRFSSLVGRAAARAAGARFVCSVHDFAGGKGLLTRLALGEDVMVYGRSVQEYLREYFAIRNARIRNITMGVSPPREYSKEELRQFRIEAGVGPDAPLIVFAGRLEHEKAPDILVDATPRILASAGDAMICIAGDGPMRSELERTVKERGLERSVRFLGWRDDTDRVMGAADIVVHLRRGREAFGLTVVEAMMLGKPVVAVDAGALRDVVKDGETGVLLETLDAGTFADAVVRLLLDCDFAARVAFAAHETAVRKWTLQAMIAETHQVYREVLQT
jgi:glycosyltransferase involved in cell wall biosynthesis